MTTTTRALCSSCGATPSGCRSLHLLGGRTCCARCTHDHRTTDTTDTKDYR